MVKILLGFGIYFYLEFVFRKFILKTRTFFTLQRL